MPKTELKHTPRNEHFPSKLNQYLMQKQCNTLRNKMDYNPENPTFLQVHIYF